MAFIDFIKIKSATSPNVADFYDYIEGFFDGGILSIEYKPKQEDYNIIQLSSDEWLLQVDDRITKVISYLYLKYPCFYINPAAFGLPLISILIYNTLLTESDIDNLFIFWAQTPIIEPDIYLSNITIEINDNKFYTSFSEAARNTLQSRNWIISPLPPPPTPTSTPDSTRTILRTPRPTPTVTKTPHPTPTITATDKLEPSVITVGGSGRAGDVDGNICIPSLDSVTQTPTNTCSTTPTPTPTLPEHDKRLIVKTIAGHGKRGNRDGSVCPVIPNLTQTPTKSPTITPTPSVSHEPYLGVITIGGTGRSGDIDGAVCDIFTVAPQPSPTPTQTDAYIGPRVKTIVGGGRTGDYDGLSCSFEIPTPTNTKTPRPTPSYTRTPEPTPSYTSTPEPSLTPTDTPGPTLTPTDTPGPTPSYTSTPGPTPSNTSTPPVTPTYTPTSSITPTPFTTPEATPTATPRCLVVTPKIEDPCCAEKAVATDHGSTTFNSRITTYAKLLNRVKSSLGYPLIQLEITDEQIYNAIDISIEFFTKFAGYTEEYLVFRSDLYRKGYGLPIGDLFSITPELADNINYACPKITANSTGYDFDLNARRIVMSVFSVAPGDNSGINTLFTIEQTIAQQAYFGHLLGNIGFDLVTFDVLKIWLKTREKVLALKPYFRFYPEQQLLRITPEPETRSTPYFGIIGAYVQKPIRELISQLWIYKYTMAQIKITMAHTRGKYGGTGLFGGQTVNYNDLMSQGTKELDELEKELKTDLIDREPIPFFLG
jgi:hypothetical protein